MWLLFESFSLSSAKLEHYVDDEISLNLPFGVVASYQWQKIGKGKTAFEHRAKKQRHAASQSYSFASGLSRCLRVK